jgi:chromosome segregation ATPase
MALRRVAGWVRSDVGLVLILGLLVLSLAASGFLALRLLGAEEELRRIDVRVSGRIAEGEQAVEDLSARVEGNLEELDSQIDDLQGELTDVEALAGAGPEFQDLADLAKASADALDSLQRSVEALDASVQQLRTCFNQALRNSFSSFELALVAGNLIYTVGQC